MFAREDGFVSSRCRSRQFSQKRGRIPNATHVGIGGTPGDGPYVRLWLKLTGETILKVGYECNGCPSSIAAASMISQLATGRSLERMILIEPNELLLLLGGLPEGKEYYADPAVHALKDTTPLENQI